MNNRLKSTAILMALVITLSAFTSLAATTAVAAATTTPTAEAATTAVATVIPIAAATTATPSVVAAAATTTTITASNTNPAVGTSITLTVFVKAGGTLQPNKQVTVTHTYPGGTSPGQDGVFNTGSSRVITFSSGPYGSAGPRVYTAKFAGDGTYGASSGTVTVNVGTTTATTTTITASNPNPTVGSAVTLAVTVKAGTTVLTNKQVTVTHTYPGGTSPGQDGVFDTGSTGTKTFSSGTYGSAGPRVYTAVFAGDGTYAKSSGTVTVNVGTTPTTATTTTITASNPNPTVNQVVAFTVTLKAGSTGLSKSVKIWHRVNDGPRVEDGTFNTVNGVYTFTQAFATNGGRVYHADFVGDSTYRSSSGMVQVWVEQRLTVLTLVASNTQTKVGETITVSGTLEQWSPETHTRVPLSYRYVKIWHWTTWPNGEIGGPYDDFTLKTDLNGNFICGMTMPNPASRDYAVNFAGDAGYKASSSSVTVQTKYSTTLTLYSTNYHPDWDDNYVIFGYLKDQNGVGIPNKQVDLWYSTTYPGEIGFKRIAVLTTGPGGFFSITRGNYNIIPHYNYYTADFPTYTNPNDPVYWRSYSATILIYVS